MKTVHSLAKEISGNIRVLKVDVEGNGLFVLQGAQKTLGRIDIIYLEVFDDHFVPYGYTTRMATLKAQS